MFPSGNTSTPTTGSLFGGGDGAKPFQAAATPSGQDNKQNVFGSQAFGSFKFGAKTSTPAASNLFSPASSGTSFSTAKPAFDFASPPNQTVGSPGFGAPQQQQQQPQNLSFGATLQPQQQQTQQQQPTPAFGTAAQTTSSFSFGKPAGTTSAFSFATPTSSIPAPAQQAAATTSSAPQSTPSFFSPTATTSASAAPAFGQGFGGGFGFAASSVASTLTSSLASTTPAPTSLSISTPALSTTSAPATGFSFGQSTVSFVPAQATTTTTAQQSQPTGLSTTTSGFSFAPKGTLNFGTTQASATTPSLAPASQPTPSLGSTTSQPVQSLGTTTTQPSLSLGTAPTSQTTLSLGTNSGLSTGLSFSKPTITAVSSAAPSTAATGLSFGAKPAATSAMVSLTTTTTTTAAAPPQAIASLTYAQLEENINKWTQKLEEQEKTFINQATQLNAWDRLVIANGEKIVELNDAVQTVKNEQESLEHEIGFVLAQQKELEELLAPMEKQLLEDPGDRLRDPEREHMYFLAENLDRQMRQMSEDLKEVIEHLNETNRSQDSNDPIVQIGRILNAHMSSMQWIDNSIAQISTKLDQLKATHDTLRRDNERSFQKTYN